MEDFTPDPRLSELEGYNFLPVIKLPPDVSKYKVLDLSQGMSTENEESNMVEWTIGRYNEVRNNMYTSNLFSEVRNIHVGIDLGAPIGTPVMSFGKGKVHSFGYNEAALDYGNVVVLEYKFGTLELWALYGHLSGSTIANERLTVGKTIEAGEVVGWIGAEDENGGWPPHVHFQISVKEPKTHDMPGVVSAEQREQALQDYPHPFHVTGRLY